MKKWVWLLVGLAWAETNRSVWDGVYTEEQAKRGQAVYAKECAACHGAELTGGESAPPLTGIAFLANWNGLTVGDLLERMRVSMPQDDPTRVSRQQHADIAAFLLAESLSRRESGTAAANRGAEAD